MTDSPICNICGNSEFGDTNSGKAIRCLECGSTERTRLMMLHLTRLQMPQPGMRVAHFAPEEGLARHLLSIVGPSYEPYNLNVEKYSFVNTQRFDLCKDVKNLPSDHYDLIIHNHVLEHLPCNYTMTLLHLHRSLKDSGWHMFSVPFSGPYYESDLSPKLPREDRIKRFLQAGHIRRFGHKDATDTLGMIFDFNVQDVVEAFDLETMQKYNINKGHERLSGASIFCFKKSDCVMFR